MEKMKVTEELLRDAFSKLSDELIEEWENIPDIDHKPSKDFEKKMKKLPSAAPDPPGSGMNEETHITNDCAASIVMISPPLMPKAYSRK